MSELIAGSRSGGMSVLRIGRPGLGCSGRWMQLGWWKRRMLALRYLWVVFGGLRCCVVVGGRVVGLRLTRSSHCSVCRAGSRNGLYAQHLTSSMQRLALASIFAPNTAEFIAAAGSVSSIPRLAGLPEVKETDLHYITLACSICIIERSL